VLRWLVAFAVTQAVEIPVYRRLARATVVEAFLASALTHPIVWFVFPWTCARIHGAAELGWSRPARLWTCVLAAEIFAVMVEAVWMRILRRDRPLVASICANAASVIIGLSLREVFGVP
jgi:hypothetical protein